jgi:hypothetical protein
MLEPYHANLVFRIEYQSDDDRWAHEEQVGLIAYAIAQLGHDLARRLRSRRHRARTAPVVPHCSVLLSK